MERHTLELCDMDQFKAANIKLATACDWNVPHIVRREKGDGKRLRRYARRRLRKSVRRKLEKYDSF